MAMLVGLVDDVLNTVQTEDKDVIWALMEVWKTLAEGVVTTDAMEADAGPEAAPAEIATMAGGGLLIILFGAVILALVVLLVIITGVKKTLGEIPVAGGVLAGTVQFVISWLRTVIRHAVSEIESVTTEAWRGVRWMFHLYAQLEGLATQSKVSHDAAVEYNHFTKWINAVQTDVRNIGNDIYNDTSGLRHAVTAINHDLSYINSEMSKLWGAVNGLPASKGGPSPAALKHLQVEINSTNADVAHLQGEIDAINRTVSKANASIHGTDTKVAEIETLQQRQAHEIAQLQAAPHTGHGLTAQQQHDLGYSNWASHMLSPLIALAPFTASFLRNASSLRSCDPCQAALPGSGSALIDGIVADLVIKDGI
jgi:hypothetical protein